MRGGSKRAPAPMPARSWMPMIWAMGVVGVKRV